ncbi:MAG: hypothetical protein JEY96_00815 [Bacteroidales bacterium]|nr:hypothetical protein [Bacteroidales bacterium]
MDREHILILDGSLVDLLTESLKEVIQLNELRSISDDYLKIDSEYKKTANDYRLLFNEIATQIYFQNDIKSVIKLAHNESVTKKQSKLLTA